MFLAKCLQVSCTGHDHGEITNAAAARNERGPEEEEEHHHHHRDHPCRLSRPWAHHGAPARVAYRLYPSVGPCRACRHHGQRPIRPLANLDCARPPNSDPANSTIPAAPTRPCRTVPEAGRGVPAQAHCRLGGAPRSVADHRHPCPSPSARHRPNAELEAGPVQ